MLDVEYPWSSFGWYLAAPEHRPGWLHVDRLLGEHGIHEDSAVGRQEFKRHTEARRLEEADEEELKPLRRGWCLGSEQFRQEMLERMDGKLGENHSGKLHRETPEQKANRMVSEELSRRGWTESDLAARRRSDPDKLAIAVRRTKPLCRSSGLRRGCKLARPKGLSPCSIARSVDNTSTKPCGPTNHAHS
jgi:hypothetical protein